MRVSAIVVSHGHREELARALSALLPQVDEAVVIANVPGSERASSSRWPCEMTTAETLT